MSFGFQNKLSSFRAPSCRCPARNDVRYGGRRVNLKEISIAQINFQLVGFKKHTPSIFQLPFQFERLILMFPIFSNIKECLNHVMFGSKIVSTSTLGCQDAAYDVAFQPWHEVTHRRLGVSKSLVNIHGYSE